MRLIPIRSLLDIFLAFHLFVQIYGSLVMIYICNFFDLTCSINPKSYFLMGFFLLLIGQKLKIEGGSFPIVLSFIVEVFYLLSLSQLLPRFFFILANIAYFLFILSLFIFQRYEIPSKNDPFLVGYRELLLENLDEISKHVAVFYPTEQKTVDVSWLPKEHFLLKTLQTNKFFRLFKGTMTFSLSFMKNITLGVNFNSDLAELNNSNFIDKSRYPVIIFSHGLGGNRHCYSVFVKWLASQGVIVFCSEHNDGFPANIKKTLQERYNVIKAILDFIHDPKKVDNFFGKSVPVNYETVSIAGHSFGGGTSFFTAIVDKRITGGVLTLDPFVVPIDDQLLNLEWRVPSLSISTERFNKTIDFCKNHEKLENLFNINKSKKKNLFCYLKNSSHLQQGDIVCLFPNLLKLLNIIDRRGNVGDQLEFNLKLLEFFYHEIIVKKGDTDQVKEKFRLHLKEKMKTTKNDDAIKILF